MNTDKQNVDMLGTDPFMAALFPFWRLRMPGFPGSLGSAALTEGLTYFAVGCFVAFFALLIVAIIQATNNSNGRREALWNIVFAVVAFICGEALKPPLVR